MPQAAKINRVETKQSQARKPSRARGLPDAAFVADPLQQLSPAQAQSLNLLVGARAVQRMVARGNGFVQPKLKVGAANDDYEREADQMAAQVMSGRPAQPQPTKAKDEGDIRGRHAESDDGFEASDAFEHELAQARSGGSKIPSPEREHMEQGFGADFGGVRLHADDRAARLNTSISAEAFTNGPDIFFGAGHERIESGEGKELFAHELAHTLQQGATTVRRKQVWPGIDMLDGADEVGEQPTRGRSASVTGPPPPVGVPVPNAMPEEQAPLSETPLPEAPVEQDAEIERAVDEAVIATTMQDALTSTDPTATSRQKGAQELEADESPISMPPDPEAIAATNRSVALTSGHIVALHRDGQAALRSVDEQIVQTRARERSISFAPGSGGLQTQVDPSARGRRLSLPMGTDRPAMPPLNGAPQRLANAQPALSAQPPASPATQSRLVPQPIVAPAQLAQPNPARAPSTGTRLSRDNDREGRHDRRAGNVQSAADVGSQATGLIDMSMGLTTFANGTRSGAEHFSGNGVTFADYNNATANAYTAGTGMVVGGVGGLISIGMSLKNAVTAIEEVGSALGSKDARRGLEATGSLIENVAVLTSATVNTVNSVNTFVGSVSSVGSTVISGFGGAAIPVLGAVVGTIGAIKNTYQIATAQSRSSKLERIASADGVDPGLKKIALYAIETNTKRLNRGIINLTANTAGAVGGIVTASGVGAGVGAAVAAGGAAVKYGAMATRMSKQALRNRKAIKRADAGKADTYAQWEKRKLDEGGFKNWLNVKLTFNWDKTTGNKNSKREEMAWALLRRGADGIMVLKHLGGNKDELERLRDGETADRANNEAAVKSIMKLFANRE